MIMLIGGYETTANTMIFLAYCIAEDKEVQEKLYKELLETKKKYVSRFGLEVAYYHFAFKITIPVAYFADHPSNLLF